MPSPFYNTSKNFLLRMLKGESKVHDIGAGFQSLGEDVDKTLTEMGEKSVKGRALVETENKYSAQVSATSGIPSASRAAFVSIETKVPANSENVRILVGGVLIATLAIPTGTNVIQSFGPFFVPPGAEWKVEGAPSAKYSQILI